MSSKWKWIFPIFILLILGGGGISAFAQQSGQISPEWSFLINGIAISLTISEDGKYIAIAYVPAGSLTYSSLHEANSTLMLMTSSGKVLWKKYIQGIVSSLAISKEDKFVCALSGISSSNQSSSPTSLYLYLFNQSGSELFSKKVGEIYPGKELSNVGSPYLGIWRISHKKPLVPLPLGPYSLIWRFYRPNFRPEMRISISEKFSIIFVPIGSKIYGFSTSGSKIMEIPLKGNVSSLSISPSGNYLVVSLVNNFSSGSLVIYNIGKKEISLEKSLGFVPLGVKALKDRVILGGVKLNKSKYYVEAQSLTYEGKDLWSFSSSGINASLSTIAFSISSSKNGSYTMISASSFEPSSPGTLQNVEQQIWVLNNEGREVWYSSGRGSLAYGCLAENGEFFALENLTSSGGVKISLLDMKARIKWSFETVGSTMGPLGTGIEIAPDSSYLISVVSWASKVSEKGHNGIWGVTAIYFFSNLAKLSVQSYPQAYVYVNGELKGKTPITLYLPPGTYTITLSKPGYYSASQNVTLGPLEYKVLSFRLWNVIRPVDYVAIGAMIVLAVLGGIAAWHYERSKHRKL